MSIEQRSRTRPSWAALCTVGLAATLLAGGSALSSSAQEGVESVDEVFAKDVRPILETYCFRCHGPEKHKAGIRFDQVDPDLVGGADAEVWSAARDMLGGGYMPPEDEPQPTAEQRRTLVDWLNASLEAAARAHAGERRAAMRRLNKAQYTHTLQELLGLEIDFGRVLPSDGKSEMGFTNNGEVLLASPLHIESYQAIARAALEQAIVLGDRPDPTHYRVTFGKGIGAGLPAATTGGYQSVPLSPNDFVVEILDTSGAPLSGADEEQRMRLERIMRKVTVGFRGSSQDRFHVVPEGIVLYSGLPHKEVPPGAWQGPSPNMKLEMQRVFPDRGDFVMRVSASRGYLVRTRKELLVSLDAPQPRATLTPIERDSVQEERGLTESTLVGAWYQAGPIFSTNGDEARSAADVDPQAPFDFEATLPDGSKWRSVGDTDGEIQRYEARPGAVYLARIIEAPSARTMDVALGSDDALWVWLNGEQVLARDVQRGVGVDQDRLALDLATGRNELLLKIVNYQGQFGSFSRIVHDGTSGGLPPFELRAEESARVLTADRSDARSNLHFEDGVLRPGDATQESSARLWLTSPAGYFQFDLVHPATPPEAMGSVRFSVGEHSLYVRPQLTPAQIERGHVVTNLGAGYLNEGLHEVLLGGPFFVGFSQLVVTPLEDDHPLILRLEAQAAARLFEETPGLRAFIGTRTDDGMDYETFDGPREVEAELGRAEVYTFHGRLEDLPIPEPESGDDEILSGIMVLGLWNDHLVHSGKETGPPLLVEAIEFEAPYYRVWPPESHTRIFFDSPDRANEEKYTREVLTRFLERAFRRRISTDELERYLGFWRGVRDEYEHYEHSVREVLVAALVSPSFLFLAEPRDTPEAADGVSEEALAARLSYFLWNSPPDEGLRRRARAGDLRAALSEETHRLLDDPRAMRFVRAFTHEWLRLDRLEQMTINPNRFPRFTRFVKRDMAEESVRFFAHVLREDMSLFTLVQSDFAMLNGNLAEFYGVEGVAGTEFRPVPVTPQMGRGGLLSQGAFLAGHSDGNEPHPIKRAVWVKEKILGAPPLPPPPNVPDLDPKAPGMAELTLKERIERHRDNPSCHDCHAGFDPFGIALEGYNAVGLLQDTRKGRPVDASVTLPDGTPVEGAEGLKDYIRRQVPEVFAASLIKHLYAYALGRDVGFADQEELQNILEEVRSREYRMHAVIEAIVTCPSFSER